MTIILSSILQLCSTHSVAANCLTGAIHRYII